MFFSRVLSVLGGVGLVAAKVQYVGMNIAGFEFGCEIDGTCPTGSVTPPLTALGGSDGAGQMQHFVSDDQMNIFRLPVSWQFLVNNNLGATLDSTNLGKYDQLMQACLTTGAYCVIDIHNFARFNGNIIGQSSSGPTNDQFTSLWTQLATKYASNDKVVFGLMNEPHDVDITAWTATCQAAVTAIRNAGASTQMILLPGNNFASAATFVSNGSGAALIGITNPDGSTTGLILDVHKYLDVDNSGTHSECTTDNIADAFALVAAFLRENGRQALVSETGAGNTAASCFTDFCAQNVFLNQNSDVFLGYIAWAAGSFATSYVLGLTPTKTNGKFVDNAMASQCVISPWLNAGTAIVTSAVASSTAAATNVVTSSASGAAASTTTFEASKSTAAATQASKTATSGSAKSTLVASTGTVNSVATSAAAGNSTATTTSASSGNKTSSQTTTSALTQVTNGAEFLRTAGGLLAGGFMAAVLL